MADSPLWQHVFHISDTMDVEWSDEEVYTAIPLNLDSGNSNGNNNNNLNW